MKDHMGVDADIATARQAGIAAGIPRAAEPLDAARVNTLGAMIGRTMQALSGGELELPKFGRVSGKLEAVPPDVGAALISVQQFLEQFSGQIPGLEPYLFDAVDAMSSNAGLDEAAAMVDGLGSDPAVLKAMQQFAASQPSPEAEGSTELDEAPPDEQTQEE